MIGLQRFELALTAVVAEDGHLFGVPVPHHDGAVLATRHHVAVLVDVALGAPDARHHVEVSVHRLRGFG